MKCSKTLSLLVNISILFISFTCISNDSFSQENIFHCPVKNGNIVNDPDSVIDGNMFGLDFLASDRKAYSCSDGKVKRIKMSENISLLIIECNIYSFSYFNLESTTLNEGDKLRAGDFVGIIKENKPLIVNLNINQVRVPSFEMKKVIKCEY